MSILDSVKKSRHGTNPFRYWEFEKPLTEEMIIELYNADGAIARIRDIVAEPELGVIYDGKVVKTVDFGAFVNFLGARDGLI